MTHLRTLDDWLAYIDSAHPRAWDLGLERVRQVAERLDVLPPAPRNVVVAGTNGKGSTSVYLEALLRAAGLKVGTTVSPHLFRFNERIRIDGVAVDDATIVAAFEAIESARKDVTLTYFEYGILAALTTFRRARVDATVLEVGLGGRLDAVNIVDGDVCVITSIGLDHQDWLGDDTEAIGAEKAGIMRAGVPCVFGERTAPASVIARARELGAPLLARGDAFEFVSEMPAATWSFRGRTAIGEVTQARLAAPAVALENAASALQAALAFGIAPERVSELCAAAANACLPGRLQRRRYRGRDVLLDVAHNPHGARFLAAQLPARPIGGRTVAVMGCLKDKDAAGIVAALAGAVDDWTFVGTGSARGQSAQDTLAKVRSIVAGRAHDDLGQALGRAAEVCGAGGRILVLGGFDVVQRALACVDARRD